MKKFCLLLLAFSISQAVIAQTKDEGLKIDQASLVNAISSKDTETINMLGRSIDWDSDDYVDGDGKSDVALMVVTFDNMSPEEIKRVTAKVWPGNGNALPVKTLENGKTVMRLIIPANGERDITFSHPVYGSDRIVGKKFKKHEVYTLNIVNSKRVIFLVESNPEGATVFFDGKLVGKTPCEIPDVSMSEHSISLTAADDSYNSMQPRVVKVTESNTRASFDLRKKKNVSFRSETKGAYMQLVDPANGNKIVASGSEIINVDSLPYGGYEIKASLNGRDTDPVSVIINNQTPYVVPVKVQETKAINFVAFQDSREVRGAQVNLGGQQIGTTPLTYNVPFGSHNVNMSYYGQSKSDKLVVNRNTSNEFRLYLPSTANTRSHWNPFDLGYNKRQWGIDLGYVNKCYVFKMKDGNSSSSMKINNWGQENKSMHGLEIGISWQPYFGYGQGFRTGVYYQLFIAQPDFIEGDPTELEHDIYIPAMYQFRLPLAADFSILGFGGFAMQIGVAHKLNFSGDESEENSFDIGFGHNEEYDLYQPEACQFYIPVGGGIQFKTFQLEFTYSWGLNDNKEMYIGNEYKMSCKARMMQARISFVF